MHFYKREPVGGIHFCVCIQCCTELLFGVGKILKLSDTGPILQPSKIVILAQCLIEQLLSAKAWMVKKTAV